MIDHPLAILGGPQAVDIPHPHYRWPIIDEKARSALLRQLEEGISIYDRSGIIERVEEQICDYFGVKHALLTNSGTSALYSMFFGLGFQKGDEIICPCYTFFATVTPLFFMGVHIVLVDIGESGNIDPEEVEAKITPRTKGILVTHMWGIPCEMERIAHIAEKNHLLLVEDGSHAHGAEYKGRKVGTFGAGAAFSLQGSKTVTGGEGGVFITDDKEAFDRALLLGHYNKRCLNEIDPRSPYYEYAVTGMGLKFRMHPLGAAIVSEQMKGLDALLASRRKMAEYMRGFFLQLPAFQMLFPTPGIASSWYACILLYDENGFDGLEIERVYRALRAEGCRELDRPRSTAPLNLLPLFQKPQGLFPDYSGATYRKGQFPKAERWYDSCLKLPVWHDIEGYEIFDAYARAFDKVARSFADL